MFTPKQIKDNFNLPSVGFRGVRYGDNLLRLHRANNLRAIVNIGTNKLYNIVTEQYRLVKHEDGISSIYNLIEEFLRDSDKYDTDTIAINIHEFDNHRKMRATFTLRENCESIVNFFSCNVYPIP